MCNPFESGATGPKHFRYVAIPLIPFQSMSEGALVSRWTQGGGGDGVECNVLEPSTVVEGPSTEGVDSTRLEPSPSVERRSRL